MQLNTIINKLCCPFDKSDVKLRPIVKDDQDNILEGILTCDECKRVYPIINGIPIMTPDEFREKSMEEPLLQKWENFLGRKKIENFRLPDK